jgi:hypothetical protein
MGKQILKQRMRLKVRRESYGNVRADRRRGFHLPGSMNPHKSTSIKQERKKK